jgi:hypothetical protein
MAQQPAAAEHHEGRAMRNWVKSPLSREKLWTPCERDFADGVEHSAALCQVFDSIYLDIPMARVKFNVNTEYAYLQNFKILQGSFPFNCASAYQTNKDQINKQASKVLKGSNNRLLYKTWHRSSRQRRTTRQMQDAR